MGISIDYSQVVALGGRVAGAGRRVAAQAPLDVRVAGKSLEDRAKANAPVLTGELRDSIHLIASGALSVEVVADSDHAGYVEYGTSEMAPEPYLNPAADGAADELAELLARTGASALL